jgi:hypothetical protein
MINNWIHFRILNKKKLKITAGINPFLYFTNGSTNLEKKVMTANFNMSAGLFADYKISNHWSANIDWRCDRGFNGEVPTGNFYCVSVSFFQNISSSLYIGLNGHLIYFDYPGRLIGSFSSGEMILGSKRYPVSLSFQAVQPVPCKSVTAPFIWNLSLKISL